MNERPREGDAAATIPEGPGAPWAPPVEFDGFRVLKPIGAGGMGRVYLAEDTLLDRHVALKFVAGDEPDPRAVRRFLVEARAIARLQHPNVVAIYRVGEVGGRPYIAYEVVDGQSLDRLPRPLPWRQVLHIGLGLSRGLAAAQQRGVLHRDVKPGNVMLSASGEVKLVDFGIAKVGATAADGAEGTASPVSGRPVGASARLSATLTVGEAVARLGPAATTRDVPPADSLTLAGTVVGTPRYLAPELWTGQPATARSDVYSLGLVLYELCTEGEERPPPEELPPLRPVAPEVPLDLVQVIARACSPEPSERFASAQEVRDALERVAEAHREGRPPAEIPPARTQYTRNGDISLAYQVVGSGPVDLVFIPGFVSHLELSWAEPSFAAFLRRMASFSRLILFDKRGTGLSDRVDVSSLGDRMDDVRAVMDAAGSERAVIFGVSEGSVLAAVFAATYPERTRALVFYGGSARSLKAPDFPYGSDPGLYEWAFEEIRRRWGEPVFLEQEAPSRAGDEDFARWWATYLKMSASPGAAIALLKANSQIDVRHLLPALRVPTLVLHREGDPIMPVQGARATAELIPRAKLVVLPGSDHLPFLGDSEGFLDALQRFVAEHASGAAEGPVVTTIVCVAPVAGAALSPGARAELRTLYLQETTRHGGSELRRSRGGGLLAAFDGPTRAVRCARAIIEGAGERGLSVGAAAHTGAMGAGPTSLRDEIVRLTTRLARGASAGELLVSRMVKDLAAAPDLRLEERAARRGLTGVAPVFAVLGGP